MPINTIKIGCDLAQGFNFRKDVMSQVGVLTKLKIGDIDLKPDITLKDPENNQKDKKVVGVLSYLTWEAAPTDAIDIFVQIGEDAKNKVDTLTKKNMSNIEVEFEFDCYAYDPKEKKYFKNFHTNETTMEGLILGEGKDLAIEMGLDANAMIQQPLNYNLRIGVKPQAKEQTLHYSSSVQDKLVMQYGVTAA
jgi:hypothetical protein